MATKNTVNVKKMRSASGELENIYSSMMKQIKNLDETMSSIKKTWTGDAAVTYLKQYEKNQKSFQAMATAIKSASVALKESCDTYDKANNSAMDLVSGLGSGRF